MQQTEGVLMMNIVFGGRSQIYVEETAATETIIVAIVAAASTINIDVGGYGAK